MKALVLEKRDGLAAVLREDGVYVTTAQPCEVGETIELSEKIVAFPHRKNRWLRSAVAAALALVIFTGSYSYLATTAYAYVSLDVEEASVEVSVNRLGRVIGVSAMNEDSAALAQELNTEMRGKRVEDAMGSAMERFHEEGVFDDPNIFVIAGVTSGSEKQREELAEVVERAAHEAGAEDGEIMTFGMSRDERREAREQEMSGGRFAFAQHGGEQTGKPLPSDNSAVIAPEPPKPETDSFSSADMQSESTPIPEGTQPDKPAPPMQPETPGVPQLPENRTDATAPEPSRQETESSSPPDAQTGSVPIPEGTQPDEPAPPMQPETPNEPPQPVAGTGAALPELPSDDGLPYPPEENRALPAEQGPSGETGYTPTERADMPGVLPDGEPQNNPPCENSGLNLSTGPVEAQGNSATKMINDTQNGAEDQAWFLQESDRRTDDSGIEGLPTESKSQAYPVFAPHNG